MIYRLFVEINQYYDENQQPATAKYFWSKMSLFDMITLSVLYLVLVAKVLPYYMRNKRPFNLKGPIFLYNVLMTIINFFFFFFFIFQKTLVAGIFGHKYTTKKNINFSSSELVLYFAIFCPNFLTG